MTRTVILFFTFYFSVLSQAQLSPSADLSEPGSAEAIAKATTDPNFNSPWEPEHRLAFSIRPQTAQIPNTTLDQHVTVGGPYFDVLRGEYRIESLANGKVRLHLTSWQRVSTDFNWYAHLWTDAVMSDLQKRILHVVRQRAEAQSVN